MGRSAARAAPPAQVAPAPAPGKAIQRKAATPRGMSNHALLRIQRCACGGTCDGCRKKGVQPKVEVGGRDDAYEREADAIAEKVMRGEGAEGAAEAEKKIQRASLEEETEPKKLGKIQRKCAACEEEEKIRGKAVKRGAEAETRAPAEEERAEPMMLGGELLTQGGAPLPAPVRGYFAGRFGRDFSAVRVHGGEAAARANDGLSALAFTYGHHIWLGEGQTAGAHALMAHELAHVVQQTSPPALRSSGKLETSRGAGPRVQRMFGVPYFEPEGRGGTETHNDVLPELRAKSGNLFTEAPIPNGSESGIGEGKYGFADLYIGDSVAGLYFVSHGVHKELKSKKLTLNGTKVSKLKGTSATIAPVSHGMMGAVQITGTANAPNDVKLGDLKPIGERAHSGVKQIENYIGGLDLCRQHVQDVSSRDGDWTSASARALKKGEIDIPPKFQPPFSGQDPRKLVLKRALWLPGGKVVSDVIWRPDPPIEGHLAVNDDVRHAGIVNHFWVPKSVPGGTLPPALTSLEPKVQQEIIDPFYAVPVKAQTKARPVQARKEDKPRVRRKAPAGTELEDPFKTNYSTWKGNVTKRTKEYTDFTGSKEGKDAAGKVMAIEAVEVLQRQSGFTTGIPAVPAGAEKESRKLSKVDFWTGSSVEILGKFRHVFGTAFVTVARLYLKARERFRNLMKEKQPKTGIPGGALGTAIKVIFKVAKQAIKFMIGQVVDKLWDSLAMGVAAKVKALIPEHITEEIDAKVEEVKALQEKLEQSAYAKLQPMIDELTAPYQEEMKKLHELQDLVSDITSLINIVRWGARVIACLSPPGWGCLWLLGEAALDKFLGMLVDTCWFQKKIVPKISGISFLKQVPVKIANLIVEKAQGFLPEGMKDVLVKLPENELEHEVSADEVECDSGEAQAGADTDLNPVRSEMMRLQEKIKDERKLKALAKLAMSTKLPRDAQMSEADMNALAAAVDQISADQLEAWAENYEKPPDGTPVGFKKFFDQMVKGRRKAKETGSKEAIPTPEVPEPVPPETPPDSETEEEGESEDGGTGTTAEGEGGEGGVSVYDAKDMVYSGGVAPEAVGSQVDVMGASSSHHVNMDVEVDLIGYYEGEAVAIVRNVPMKVVNLTYEPEDADVKTADYRVIHYKLRQGVRLPGAGTLAKGELLCYYMGWKVGTDSLSPAKECP